MLPDEMICKWFFWGIVCSFSHFAERHGDWPHARLPCLGTVLCTNALSCLSTEQCACGVSRLPPAVHRTSAAGGMKMEHTGDRILDIGESGCLQTSVVSLLSLNEDF
jgi:hypothetical protein